MTSLWCGELAVQTFIEQSWIDFEASKRRIIDVSMEVGRLVSWSHNIEEMSAQSDRALHEHPMDVIGPGRRSVPLKPARMAEKPRTAETGRRKITRLPDANLINLVRIHRRYACPPRIHIQSSVHPLGSVPAF
ncbi:hypothetical protein PM082_014726 [Marasmius tenuissimus]|nr:hypothetical protein PM082_014726 [Marasmius tenuissimus]